MSSRPDKSRKAKPDPGSSSAAAADVKRSARLSSECSAAAHALSIEVIGIDHLYITASSLRRSERFYDRVMTILGFR
jgi:hypothetical protein